MRKAASSATGFIGGVSYIKAALTGILFGWLTGVWGWDVTFYLWISEMCRVRYITFFTVIPTGTLIGSASLLISIVICFLSSL